MSFYPLKFPKILTYIFPNLITEIPNKQNQVFLTFDDGPTPEITHFVLDLLDKHNAKATFFCIGNNIEKYPEILREIKQKKHAVGNHTFQHDDAWKYSDNEYFKSIEKTRKILAENGIDSHLFRPPFGRLTPRKIRLLNRQNYKIVMWRLITGDYNRKINAGKVANKIIKQTKSGDVIVFHDSLKAFDKLKIMLPLILAGLSKKGFVFSKIA